MTMVSHPRSGTTASAQLPNTASPEANSPPNTASTTRENPTVRSTGHTTRIRLVALIVRPSRGRPRRPDNGQAMTARGTARTVRARVSPAAATTTATSTETTTTPPASRRAVTDTSSAAMTAHARVNQWRRKRATRHMSTPAPSIVAVTASPMSRSGHVRAAQAPTPSAVRTTAGWGELSCSGHSEEAVKGPSPPGAGGAGSTGAGDGLGVTVLMVFSSCRWVGRVERGRRGRTARSSAPVVSGGVGTAATSPPCSSATHRAMARPRPVPPEESSPEPKRSKTRSARSAGIPGPSSRTSRVHRASSSTRAVRSTSPPAGLWRTALSTRLATSWARRPGSARTTRPAGSTSSRTRTGRPSTDASATAARSSPATSTSRRRSGATPASMRERSSRSVTSSLSRSDAASAPRRASSSGRTTPSTRFSRRAR